MSGHSVEALRNSGLKRLTEMSMINSCGILANENPYLVFGGIKPKFLSLMSAQDATTLR